MNICYNDDQILSVKINYMYTLLHLNSLPIFKISQY